jgi:hypothetical protein
MDCVGHFTHISSFDIQKHAPYGRRVRQMKILTSILLQAAILILAGCASSSSGTAKPAKPVKVDPKTVNWGERIGTYTFDQAMVELGRPALVGESSAGRTAEWVLRRSPQMSFGFGVGGGSYGSGGGVGVGVGSGISPPPHGENLRLIFDPDGKLKEWAKVKY